MLAPRHSNKSALPEDEETALPPCLATLAPAEAATNIAAVEILKVCAPSPPVPHRSTKSSKPESTGLTRSRITSAPPSNSLTASPFIFNATNIPAVKEREISPFMIFLIRNRVSVTSRSFPMITCSKSFCTFNSFGGNVKFEFMFAP